MTSEQKANLFTGIMLAVFVGLPLLSWNLCSVSTANGLNGCVVNFPGLGWVAEATFFLVFISAFTFLIPILTYSLVLYLVIWIGRRIFSTK